MASRPPKRPPALPIGLMVAGSEMAGFTIFGVILDLVVFDTLPWFTIGLTLLGLVAGFLHLVVLSKAMSKPASPPPQDPPAGGVG